jgi:tetratricopeptide (TPR) repeat protein
MPADVIAFRQGEIAEALGRESEACDAFAEAVRLFPGSKAALKALARTARRVGDLDRAIAATRASLELAPAGDVMGTTRARGELASLLAASGDLAGAIHYYELVVAEEPKAAGALAELLTLYADKGDYAGAARCLQSLIALTPEASGRADLLYRLGEIYRGQLGDDDLAADAYLKAVDLAPDHAPVLRRLLEYYFRVGDEAGLLEVAADLSRAHGLTRRESGRENLARTMLLAAARNRWVLVDEIGAWFGGETIDRLALAMVETAGAGRTSWSAEDLGAAGNAVCDRLGLEAATLARLLGDRAESGDEIAAALLATLPDAGG